MILRALFEAGSITDCVAAEVSLFWNLEATARASTWAARRHRCLLVEETYVDGNISLPAYLQEQERGANTEEQEEAKSKEARTSVGRAGEGAEQG